ncbi:class I SAM-dependent methyltransferase [Pseudonocardia acaciae]|uniref:class I SAM-dependent methyltransferase n=1 Tax=Pseudonocardia acaciae TaxID=551276 RepID=UPI00048F581E|nr:class I SAM-dependent methyltransferase [Pseudonocardia acaciae]
MTDRIAASYDAIAEQYTEAVADELDGKPLDRALLDCFLEQLPPGAGVCDVGCGPGQVAAYLHEHGTRPVMGVDLSGAMVAVAARAHPAIRFEQATMTELPMPDGTLAGITAFYSIIHLDDAELRKAAAEFARVLAPSGRALVAFHGGDQVVHADRWFDQPVDLDGYHRPPELVASVLEQAGLDVDATVTRRPYPGELPTTRCYLMASRPA